MGKMRIKKEIGGDQIRTGRILINKEKRKKISISEADVYIKSTFNNTIISYTDKKGEVLFWASAGSLGFKGTKKSTPYAALVVATNIASAAKEVGIRKVNIYVKGVGMGRESAIRATASTGIDVVSIKDVTPLPHNGCRPKKVRRP